MLRLGKEVMIFDGGFGSELEKLGLDGIPEDLNITHAERIRDIHRAYSCADFVSANTFGLNRIKYKGKYGLKEVAIAAIQNARAAGKYVFADVGPTGAMLAPVGTLSFEDAYEAFAEFARITSDYVDGYIAETFSDLYELKACVLALKENSDKTVFATMTFDKSGRTLTGTTPEIAVNTLEGLGVDALGVNCSLGPKELLETVRRITAVSGVPVIVQPNRGLPVIENGKTVYKLGIDEFVRYAGEFVKIGVSVLGGCCGTTPEFIRAISEKYGGAKVKRVKVKKQTVINSATKEAVIDGVKICGERLNPTGKPKLKEALKAGNYDYLVDEAVRQAEAGADLLDLNVGLPETDEAAVMEKACRKIQEFVDLPIQIDSSDACAIERGVRAYNGIPLINSVNGEAEVMDRIFPIAKKYGAVVLGLTMDGNGVPKTAKERYSIAKRIVERAESYGIPRHKIMIDTLALTASAEQKLVCETTEALRLVKALGVKTALGVSNVSFGLPNRPLLNKTFLTMAMTCGLDMPIMNPLDSEMTGAVKAFKVLNASDKGSADYIETYKDFSPQIGATTQVYAKKESGAVEVQTLYDCVVKGLKNKAESLCESELEKSDPMTVINDVLIAALTEVGNLYDSGKIFLPQLISSAEAAKTAFSALRDKLPKVTAELGTVVLATVKGDVHDIGKNIVKVVSESYGYSVVDLGKDVPASAVTDAVRKYKPIAVGLSALMTTTVKSMAQTIKTLRDDNCPCPVFVGGAVLNAEIAREIGADFYTRDALGFVKALQTLK